MRKIFLALTVVIGLVLSLSLFFPWKPLIESRLQAALEEKGLKNVQLTLSDLGLHGATLQNLAIGDQAVVTLKNIAFSYSPLELWNGRLRALNFHDISFDVGSSIKVQVAEGNFSAEAAGKDVILQGPWHLKGVQFEGLPAEVPPLEGTGTLKMTAAGAMTATGHFKSADNSYHADFTVDHPETGLKISSIVLPWKGGTLAAKNVTIPFMQEAQAIEFVLKVQQVSVEALMQALTGKQITATGTVSGDLPLTIGRQGAISFGAGRLTAAGPGIITVPENVIPGDNPQIVMTRDILKNFHYQSFTAGVTGNDTKGVSIQMTLEGNNPDQFNGRPVKLTVHLGGDLLDFIRQNILFLTDSKAVFRQDYP